VKMTNVKIQNRKKYHESTKKRKHEKVGFLNAGR